MVWIPGTAYIGSVLRIGTCDWLCGFLVQHILWACWGQGSVIGVVASWYSIHWERAEDREVWLMVWFPSTAYIGSVLRTGKCDWWCGFLVKHILWACWGEGSVIDGVASWYSIILYWERAEDREVWLVVWFPGAAYIGSVLRTGKCDWCCGFLVQHILGACWGQGTVIGGVVSWYSINIILGACWVQGSVIDGVASWYSIYWEHAGDREVWVMVARTQLHVVSWDTHVQDLTCAKFVCPLNPANCPLGVSRGWLF